MCPVRFTSRIFKFVSLFVLSPWIFSSPCASASAKDYDVVIYGATAGGTMAAIAAAGEGVRVALLEPGRHVGGRVNGRLHHGTRRAL
jgi:ribulose 1,5-bisphosphate synthetase/thiazole synthase